MLRRQRTGSVLCTSCGVLVGVGDDTCYNCGRRNPGLWGYAPALRSLGSDLGFVPFVIGACVVIYALTLVFSRGQIGMRRPLLDAVALGRRALHLFGASGAYPVFELRPLVDGAERRLAARRPAAHPVQHDGRAAAGAGRRPTCIGPGRMVIIYVARVVAGFALSSLAGGYFPASARFSRGGQFTVGASAASPA